MKLENMEKANELSESIKRVDGKITELNHLNLTAEPDYTLTVGDGLFTVRLFPQDIGPEKAAEIQNELWDALLKTKADLTAELEKL